MRKFLLSATLVATSFTMFAQKLDDVQEKISKGKYAEAKESLDKFMNDPKNKDNANAYYYQGVIYNELAKDSTKTPATDYRQEAFTAFKRYQELDPKNVLMTLEQNGRLFQLYEGYYNAAIKSYNAQQYDKAFYNFKNALNVEQYINSKGFTYGNQALPKLDTNLILNTAAMALKSNQQDSAMSYYQRLADAKIGGDKFEEVYQMLVDYYAKKNDEANRQKYTAIGTELYPNSEYWLQSQLTPFKDDKPKLFAKYDELVQANPTKYFLAYNYAVELFNYLYASDAKPTDAATWNPKLEAAITKAISIDPTPEANLLMVRYLSEQVYKNQDAVKASKGTSAAEISKRKSLNAQTIQLYDKMAPYAQAAYDGYSKKDTLKGSEKGNLRYVTNVLIDYYTAKKQMDKVKTYEDKLKTL